MMSSEQIITLVGAMVIPILMLVLGSIFKNNAPKKINTVVGYRTKNSMKSQEAWDYANSALGKSWQKVGLIMLIVSLLVTVGLIMANTANVGIVLVIMMTLQVAVLIGTIFPIEKQLKEKF